MERFLARRIERVFSGGCLQRHYAYRQIWQRRRRRGAFVGEADEQRFFAGGVSAAAVMRPPPPDLQAQTPTWSICGEADRAAFAAAGAIRAGRSLWQCSWSNCGSDGGIRGVPAAGRRDFNHTRSRRAAALVLLVLSAASGSAPGSSSGSDGHPRRPRGHVRVLPPRVHGMPLALLLPVLALLAGCALVVVVVVMEHPRRPP